MKPIRYFLSVIGISITLALTPQASAEDTLKIANGQRGAWESSVAELGQRAGIFRKHGIVVDLHYTQGNDETEQSVLSGSVDIGVGVVITDVLRAYARGAPVRIVGANVTGATNYWYVLATSPIQSIKDLVGKTIAYARNGSSSHYDALDFVKQFHLKATLVSTGGAAATFRQVMSRQIDVGWAEPPFGIDQVDQGKIRVLARANDVFRVRGKTFSVLITNGRTLAIHKDVLARFMDAYRETIDWMYSDPAALETYAEFAGVSKETAKQLRNEFVTKEMLLPDKIVGLKEIMRVSKTRLSRRQRAELIQIPISKRNALTDCSRSHLGCMSIAPVQSP